MDKFKLFVNFKYFSKLDEDTLSPVRFSSLHYKEEKQTETTDEIDVKWQWTVLDNRIQLLGNFLVTAPKTQTLKVRLPVIANMIPAMEIIGYGRIAYGIDPLGVDVFSSNTPLVFIAKDDSEHLQIKSMLFDSIPQKYHIATHITYIKNYDNEITEITFDKQFYMPGDTIKLSFKTRTPVNSFYLGNILLFAPWIYAAEGENISHSLYGSQKRWSLDISVPSDSVSGIVSASIKLHNIDYVIENVSFIDTKEALGLGTFEIVENTNSFRITLGGLDDDTPMTHNVRVRAHRLFGDRIDFDKDVKSDFSIHSEDFDVTVDNLVDNTDYIVTVVLTDTFDRQVAFESTVHRTLNIEEPTLYDLNYVVHRDQIHLSANVNHDDELYWRVWATAYPVQQDEVFENWKNEVTEVNEANEGSSSTIDVSVTLFETKPTSLNP